MAFSARLPGFLSVFSCVPLVGGVILSIAFFRQGDDESSSSYRHSCSFGGDLLLCGNWSCTWPDADDKAYNRCGIRRILQKIQSDYVDERMRLVMRAPLHGLLGIARRAIQLFDPRANTPNTSRRRRVRAPEKRASISAALRVYVIVVPFCRRVRPKKLAYTAAIF